MPLMNNIHIYGSNRVPFFAYNTKLHILRSIIIMCSYSYRLVKHWNSKNFLCETNSQNAILECTNFVFAFPSPRRYYNVVELEEKIFTETTTIRLKWKILFLSFPFFFILTSTKIEIDEHAISNWRWLLWIHLFQFMCFSICRIAWIHSELLFEVNNFKCNTSTMNGTFEKNFERVSSVLWELFYLCMDSVWH